jgi:hypothetical protein
LSDGRCGAGAGAGVGAGAGAGLAGVRIRATSTAAIYLVKGKRLSLWAVRLLRRLLLHRWPSAEGREANEAELSRAVSAWKGEKEKPATYARRGITAPQLMPLAQCSHNDNE